MTVGRLEKPPYDEQVIQMLFDVTKWTEEQAYKWLVPSRMYDH